MTKFRKTTYIPSHGKNDFVYQVFELIQDDNATTADNDYVIYDSANDDAPEPRTANSRDSMNTRDENDGSEGNDRNNKNEYHTRPHAATSRDALIFNDEDDVSDNAAKDEPRSELERRP